MIIAHFGERRRRENVVSDLGFLKAERMSGASSCKKRVTRSIRARTLLIFHDAIFECLSHIPFPLGGLAWLRAMNAVNEDPRSGGVERGSSLVLGRNHKVGGPDNGGSQPLPSAVNPS